MDISNDHIEIIKTLWSSDPLFRKFVEERLKEWAGKAQQDAQELLRLANKAQDLIASKPDKPTTIKQKNSPNHREAVMKALKERPGMTSPELRSHLKTNGHIVDRRVLNTLLNNWKNQFLLTKGKKGVRTEGDSPWTKFYAPE